jgi:hypothetical protein
VLVTNDPSIPRRCDRVILMGNVPNSVSCSTVLDVGSYDELLSRGHQLRSVSSTEVGEEEEKEDELGVNEAFPRSGTSHSLSHENAHHTKSTKVSRSNFVERHELVVNGTECGHADPESQVVMENCPDYMTDSVCQISRDFENNNEIVVDLFGANRSFTAPELESVRTRHHGSSSTESFEDGASSVEPFDTKSAELSEKKVSSADDSMTTGAVPLSTYVSYFKSVRQPFFVFAMVAAYIMANGAQFFQQYTVVKWTEVGGGGMAAAMNLKYMRSLINAAWVVSFFLWMRSYLTMQVGVRASEYLHSKMLSSVFSAPMSFFDATPSGQLLSRFGKEMETVDRGVPDSIGSTLFCFLQIFMSVGALAGVITPAMLIPLGLTGFFYAKAMLIFRPAARDLKRAETITRSPIYTHFGEALRGTEIIRSVPGARRWWSGEHRSLADTNLGVFFTIKVLDRWLSTRLENLGNTVVFTAAVASVLLTRAGSLKAGSAGWGLTQSLAITGLMTWAVRCLTDLETNMYVKL